MAGDGSDTCLMLGMGTSSNWAPEEAEVSRWLNTFSATHNKDKLNLDEILHKTSTKASASSCRKGFIGRSCSEPNLLMSSVDPDRPHRQCSSLSSDDDNLGMGSKRKSSDYSSESSSKRNRQRSQKGPATDPQSVYARHRRERINQRLKLLQKLVPNGSKVDISTMLEEAINYVKFLQLQVKFLSSDEYWMYTPIAYNGVDFALNIRNE